ncbi:B3/B4 domain-containing protein [Lapidilactobacillus gannanensis]|uniref:B3/4 domain-containing protein n=1 Tax=Lapidilactobacillus gannanensis TaxID=2486002 RepID=A0ABW4BMV9_9LACO|nr:phenylalanine--tRNA ligase beta subunit-related protein [Lapidilactobacillus gannanensis]
MEITISPELQRLCPAARLLTLRYHTKVTAANDLLTSALDDKITSLADKITLPEIAKFTEIAATRTAYKALGKSPSQYRNAAEAMLRRVVKGQGLYRINNVVDLNNLMSISSGWSIGSYDCQQIQGPITWQRAPEKSTYAGIGKSDLNIEFLPTLADKSGLFGNPTSDSQRTMVTEQTTEVLTVVYTFSEQADLNELGADYRNYLQEMLAVTDVEIAVVGE